MSRCFPYPPPGFEKKPRSEHSELLTKEKHKEKKHKKEKREKEKKESKERKDKDRSKDKHKEKKDRKEKHKDKKKDKDGDKDNNRKPEDRRIEEQTESYNDQKLGVSIPDAKEGKDSRFTEELGRRIRDEERGAADRMVGNIPAPISKRVEGLGTATAMEKQRSNRNEEKGAANRIFGNISAPISRRVDGLGAATAVEKERSKGYPVVANLPAPISKRAEGLGSATPMEMERGNRDDERGTANRMFGNISAPISKRVESLGTATALEKQRGNGNPVVSNLSPPISKKVEGLGTAIPMEKERVIKNGDRGAVNRVSGNISAPISKRVEGLGIATAMGKERGNGNPVVANLSTSKRVEGLGTAAPMEKERGNRDEERGAANRMFGNISASSSKKAEGLGTTTAMEKERGSGNPLVGNILSKGQKRIDGFGRPVENQPLFQVPVEEAVKSFEGKKAKDREADGGKEDRHKDKERDEKKNKGKDKNRDKKKEKEEKKREKAAKKQSEHERLKNFGKKDQLESLNSMPLAPHINDDNIAGNDGHSKKRKAIEMNGFLHDEVRSNKLPRPLASSHEPVENGRTLEFGCGSTSHSSLRNDIPNNVQAERVLNNKEHKINGTAHPVDLKPSLAGEGCMKGETFTKPPHPDSKYLNQIYSVPNLEECPESDDQEWLFSSSSSQQKAKAKFPAGEAPQVWAEGLQIEAADVFALPYVIPF